MLTVLLMAAAPTGHAEQWTVDRENSRLGFVASYDEVEFDSHFGEFRGAVTFDADDPAAAALSVSVDIPSVDSDSPDRDEGMLESDWFDASDHPVATFESNRVEDLGGNVYEVRGDLTIKGQTRATAFRMEWNQSSEATSIKGSFELDRRDFRIGAGEWEDDDTIGFGVKVFFAFSLLRTP